MSKIFVNQLGYLPNEKKIAIIETDSKSEKKFALINEKNEIVFSGEFSDEKNDELAGGSYALLDFSKFMRTGEFSISVGEEKSHKFIIANDVYSQLYESTLKYFSLSRCGEKIVDDVWGHEACHTGLAEIYGTNEKKEVDGGWHDAGDYGRYIVAGAKTVMDLLLTQKNHKSKFDLLSEIRFELEWMLKMQREDGTVYHKVSCYRFCNFILPQDEKDTLVISPVSTAATADFAGTCAYASQFFSGDKIFSDKLLTAAKNAQKYLDSHDDEFFSNPPEIKTGGYGDINVKDERYFALCALFSVTKNSEYLEKAISIFHENHEHWFDGFGWGSFAGFGNEILLFDSDIHKFIEFENFFDEIKNRMISLAEKFLATSNENIFAIPIKKIGWGSNGAIMDCAHVLQIAYKLTNRKDFYDAAVRQIHYILGVNPMNLCYITGFGKNSIKNPHHRQSGFLKQTMPGMLSGGPAEGLWDETAKKELQGKAPLKCFIDKTESYSTNEIAIYWNSAFTLGLANLITLTN